MTITAPRPAVAISVDPTFRRRVWALFTATTILTVFDAAASWWSITLMKVAVEGNGILGALATAIGFEGALVIRVAWGVGLTLLLALFALRTATASRRRLAYRGLVLITAVLGVLAAWHVVGMGMSN